MTELISNIESSIQSSTLKPWEHSLPNNHAIIPNCPPKLKIVLANHIYIPITTLPSRLVARLKRLATFANPVFFKKQSMRFSTHGIPRYICLAEVEQSYLIIPRGCLDDALEILKQQEISAEFEDKRESGQKLEKIRFLGQLRTDQARAVEKLIVHDV